MNLDLNRELVTHSFYKKLLPDLVGSVIMGKTQSIALGVVAMKSYDIFKCDSFKVVYDIRTSKLLVLLMIIDNNSFHDFSHGIGFNQTMEDHTLWILYDIEDNRFTVTSENQMYESTDFTATWEE